MQQAFILRIAPSNVNKVPLALKSDQVIIGWSATAGLLDLTLSWKAFRKKLHDTHYAPEKNLRRAGGAAGHMWRFVRDMKMGDLVVVPNGPKFYLAEITSDALYLPEHTGEDTSYRRNVRWLNNKKAIPRDFAKAPLISRMKVYGTTALATDVLDDIRDALARAEAGNKPSFKYELQTALVKETVQHLRSGHMDSFSFEHLIKDLLIQMGAKTATVVPRLLDKGADILATFRVAETFQYTLAVQAKHWNDKAPVNNKVVEQLIDGIEAANATLGMVITSGTIAESAVKAAEDYAEATGIQIELVDGDQFAKLLIEQGIGKW
ncbi:restriction endonuclease [Pseudomonas sp. 10S4]|uniref:restriction endonuclease n=2 Tax=Pseudomonas sp. 10S4 TaxID=3048583 RepID=UPI002B228801|nr:MULTISPECIES: restriction endonuclease [unclassified Pseudomonas]MEB0222900.1 restriction endonuclease [Pseudomonas sp. 5S1]MEB0293055.1 restriction endonuclease [Pseudomonas sp. 10S4]